MVQENWRAAHGKDRQESAVVSMSQNRFELVPCFGSVKLWSTYTIRHPSQTCESSQYKHPRRFLAGELWQKDVGQEGRMTGGRTEYRAERLSALWLKVSAPAERAHPRLLLSHRFLILQVMFHVHSTNSVREDLRDSSMRVLSRSTQSFCDVDPENAKFKIHLLPLRIDP